MEQFQTNELGTGRMPQNEVNPSMGDLLYKSMVRAFLFGNLVDADEIMSKYLTLHPEIANSLPKNDLEEIF